MGRAVGIWPRVILVSSGLLLLGVSGKPMLHGFDLTAHNIPVEDIRSGGPPRDGIPALADPDFIMVDRASYLGDEDRILGLAVGREARAYPIKILNWHEIVNDQIDGKPVLMSYCPLCGTGMAFDPVINGKRYTFGVSGLLYNSDVLMYDHQTESLWSQIKQEAVTGDLMGSRLPLLPLLHTTWGVWKKEHPNSLVLSSDTGYRRDYGRDPYASYARSSRLMFPVGRLDRRLGPKSWVLGLELNGTAKAYPFSELEQVAQSVTDSIGSQKITVHYDPASRTARVRDANGKDVPSVVAYWFAWAAFHPKTEVYIAPKSGNSNP